MKPQAKKQWQIYISYTKQGCPDIFELYTIFPVCFGLLAAQVFRKSANHIESSNISMPGLLIT